MPEGGAQKSWRNLACCISEHCQALQPCNGLPYRCHGAERKVLFAVRSKVQVCGADKAFAVGNTEEDYIVTL